MKFLDVCMVCSVSIIFRWPFGANSSPGTHPLGQDNIITLVLIIFSTFVTSMRTEPTFVGHMHYTPRFYNLCSNLSVRLADVMFDCDTLWRDRTLREGWRRFVTTLWQLAIVIRYCCSTLSSASAAALQLRFKLLLLLCFVYMVGSCVMYCPWLALV